MLNQHMGGSAWRLLICAACQAAAVTCPANEGSEACRLVPPAAGYTRHGITLDALRSSDCVVVTTTMRHPGRGIEIAAQLARATPVVAPDACCARFVPLTFCREEARLLDANGTCNVSTARNTGKEAMGLLIAFSDEVLRPALARACGVLSVPETAMDRVGRDRERRATRIARTLRSGVAVGPYWSGGAFRQHGQFHWRPPLTYKAWTLDPASPATLGEWGRAVLPPDAVARAARGNWSTEWSKGVFFVNATAARRYAAPTYVRFMRELAFPHPAAGHFLERLWRALYGAESAAAARVAEDRPVIGASRALGAGTDWWANLSTPAAARYQYGGDHASACADARARQRAWRSAYEHAGWVADAPDLGACEPRGAPCVEDSLSGCCDRGPVPGPAPPRAGSFVAVSLASSEAPCAVRQSVVDVLAVAVPATLVVIHVGCYSPASPTDRVALADAFPGRAVLNPACVPTLRAYGSILHAHLRNVKFLAALYGSSGPSHVILAAANLAWRARGFEAFAVRTGASALAAPAFRRLDRNRTFDAADGDWARLNRTRAGDGVLVQKHEGAFYPFAVLERMVAFLEAAGPLGRLNARTCLGCAALPGLCVEELYPANLYRLLTGAGGAPCAADDACRPWDGTLAARADHLRPGDLGATKFAVKDWRHRGCDGAPEPDAAGPAAPPPVSAFDCASDDDCDAARRERCVGRGEGPGAAWPGQCVVEAPPAPWAFTCAYAYPAVGGVVAGAPVVPDGAPCLTLVVDAAPPRVAAAPAVAVLVVGLAEGLDRPQVYERMRSCFLRNLGRHDVFVNLELAADPKTLMADARWNHAGRAVGARDVAPALAALRPRLVTLGEPRIEGFADGGNAWNRSDWYSGTRHDTHCGGRAWKVDLHYGAGRAVRIYDRYRRAMLLVNAAERADGRRYDWVAKLRPDLFFAAPVGFADVFGDAGANVAVRWAWFNAVSRDAATAGFVDGALTYWRCAGVEGLPGHTTVKDETWLAESLRRGGAPIRHGGAELRAAICLLRATPDDDSLCAARRRANSSAISACPANTRS